MAGATIGDAALAEAAVVKMAATPRAAVTTNDLSEIADIFEPLRFVFRSCLRHPRSSAL
jgi:hypothetical protein